MLSELRFNAPYSNLTQMFALPQTQGSIPDLNPVEQNRCIHVTHARTNTHSF